MPSTIKPCHYWSCGGDILMRVPGQQPVVVSEEDATFLFEVMETERRIAEGRFDGLAVAEIFCRFAQLTCARMQSRRWRRASGDWAVAA